MVEIIEISSRPLAGLKVRARVFGYPRFWLGSQQRDCFAQENQMATTTWLT
jgi:hypothetical protein